MFRGHDQLHVWALVRIVVFYQLHIEVWDASSISVWHGLETCISIEVYIVMLILMDSRRVYLTFVRSNCSGATSKKKNRAIRSSGLLHIIRYRTVQVEFCCQKNTCETCSSYAFFSMWQMEQKSCLFFCFPSEQPFEISTYDSFDFAQQKSRLSPWHWSEIPQCVMWISVVSRVQRFGEGLGFWWWKSMLGFGMSSQDLSFRDSFSLCLLLPENLAKTYTVLILLLQTNHEISCHKKSPQLIIYSNWSMQDWRYISNWCYISTIPISFQQKKHKKYNFLLVRVMLLYCQVVASALARNVTVNHVDFSNVHMSIKGAEAPWTVGFSVPKTVAWWVFEVAFWGRKLGA